MPRRMARALAIENLKEDGGSLTPRSHIGQINEHALYGRRLSSKQGERLALFQMDERLFQAPSKAETLSVVCKSLLQSGRRSAAQRRRRSDASSQSHKNALFVALHCQMSGAAPSARWCSATAMMSSGISRALAMCVAFLNCLPSLPLESRLPTSIYHPQGWRRDGGQ
jgi:hypothetical protein